MHRRLILFGSLAVVLIGVLVAVALSSRVVPPTATTALPVAHIEPGQMAPPFQISSTAGPFDIRTLHRPLLLELFASWCPHCRREVTVLNRIYHDDAARLAMLAVSASPYAADGLSPETQADVVLFAEQLGVTYPIAYDPNLDVAHAYLSGGYPTIILIDRHGRIVSTHHGEESEAELRRRIEAAVARK